MLKVWNAAFWQAAPDEDRDDRSRHDADPRGPGREHAGGTAATEVRTRLRPALTVPALLLAASAVVLGVWAGPLLAAADAAAAGLVDTAAYVAAVTGP
jgi:multicomponent Na+:H+ antiporter subunit D